MFGDEIKLNSGSDELLEGNGYKHTLQGLLLKYSLIAFTFGILKLVFHWRPDIEVLMSCKKCAASEAEILLLKDCYKQTYVVRVHTKAVETNLSSEYFYKASSKKKVPKIKYQNCNAKKKTYKLMNEDQESLIECSESWFDAAVFRYIEHLGVRYIWHPKTSVFERLSGLDNGEKFIESFSSPMGITDEERHLRQVIYGKNTIEIELKPYLKLFFEEVFNPFYVFQIGSISLWLADSYYYFAATIFFISLVSISVSLYETRKQALNLHNMVKTPQHKIKVYQQKEDPKEHDNHELVPGDVIEIEVTNIPMCCDAVLLCGNVIVNEAMLTGESVPVTKIPLPKNNKELLSSTDFKKHILYCGTTVMQTKRAEEGKIKALVIRTGFLTARGELIRSIMHPKPLDFKFYIDAARFVLVLFMFALGGMGFSVYFLIKYGRQTSVIILRVFDIATVVVPPALPAAMTIGIVYAQKRLKSAGIFCISPPRINLCGKVNLMCFDKTGTLTEDSLDVWGMLPSIEKRLTEVYKEVDEVPNPYFINAMATSHSLAYIDGKLSGDPLDLKMFETTKWELKEAEEGYSKTDIHVSTVVRPPLVRDKTLSPRSTNMRGIGLVKQFPFSSNLQRMSVITRCSQNNETVAYVKGSPEKIISLCCPHSIPTDFQETLYKYSMQGYRVIAFAYKSLTNLPWHDIQKLTRDDVEKDLTFCGFLIMQNALKAETKSVIEELHLANIRTVMVTGDNILTAISIAREAGMISKADILLQAVSVPSSGKEPPSMRWTVYEYQANEESYAIREFEDKYKATCFFESIGAAENIKSVVDGQAFADLMKYYPDEFCEICLTGVVFARMVPEQKAQLVKYLQSLDYTVGMCGDGANDCSALKAAHAGVSLSEAEASVASPFTSKISNISCVPILIKEGRAALATSFGCFKFMALYGLTQYVSVLLLYTCGTSMTDTQFLYIDLMITSSTAFFMGHTLPYDRIVPRRPKSSLFSFYTLFSVISQLILMTSVQVICFVYLKQQIWYKPGSILGGKETFDTIESSMVFVVSTFQYIILAVNFSIGPPHRKQIWTNKPLFVTVVILSLCSLLLLIYPTDIMVIFLKMKRIAMEYYGYKIILLLIISNYFLMSMMIESFVINSQTFRKLSRVIRGKWRYVKRYRALMADLRCKEYA